MASPTNHAAARDRILDFLFVAAPRVSATGAPTNASIAYNAFRPTCNGTYKWKQAHDSSNKHASTTTWKTRSMRVAGNDLFGTLL